MALMDPGLRKWLAWGTGIGIEVAGENLNLALARLRPGGYEVLAEAEITDFRHRPAVEWGREYSRWTRKHGCGGVAAVVVLPSGEMVVRVLSLGSLRPQEIHSAVELQLDSLHPWGDEEIQWSSAPLPGTGEVAVAIARRQWVDQWAAVFVEAGVRVYGFVPSAAAIWSALRLPGPEPTAPVLAWIERNGEIELYGEGPARPLLTAVVDMPLERALHWAAAELRLEDQIEPLPIAQLLPRPRKAPQAEQEAGSVLARAAALVSACPRLALSLNLLPEEYRSQTSRAAYVPTAVLGVLLVAGLTTAFAVQRWQDRRYEAALRAEIAKYAQRVERVRQLEQELQELDRRRRAIEEFQARVRRDLDTLAALSQMIEPPAWVRFLQLDRDSVSLGGEAPHAGSLLKTLDDSPWFYNSEFVGSLGKGDAGQSFTIRARREAAPTGGQR